MAWRRPGDRPLYIPMLVSLLTYICVTRKVNMVCTWSNLSCRDIQHGERLPHSIFVFASDSASVSGSMEYGVVIDAGSSGSRVRVYTWTPRHCSEELPGNVHEIFNFKVVDKFKTKTKARNTPEPYPTHDEVMKWKPFPRYWPFVREIHRSLVNSPQEGQWRGALMFLWSAPEKTVVQTIETPLIWDAIALIMMSL